MTKKNSDNNSGNNKESSAEDKSCSGSDHGVKQVVGFKEKMRLLVESFADELPQQINDIGESWEQLQVKRDVEAVQVLHRQVYSLIDSSKTFGFPELAVAARGLEKELKVILQNDLSVDGRQMVLMQQYIDDLKSVAASAGFDFNQDAPSCDDAETTTYIEPCRLVFVVDDDVEAADELVLQLSYYGYEAKAYYQLEKLQVAINKSPDAIILMDIEFPGDELDGIAFMREIQKGREKPVQVVFISARDDLIHRLDAVRAGGCAFFVKPIDPTDLIDQLDSLITPRDQEPYRIMIVDDSPTTLRYHAVILEQADMVVKAVQRPIEVMELLIDFLPDIILMDVYMPDCSGVELAKVIRQLGKFVSTPIVYLSSEGDFNTQQEAMSLAGDDFLVKPIDPQQLISAVNLRVRRARLLRSLMVRDGLTSLYNHTSLMSQLEQEISRSERLNIPLSFVMLDIDYFKKVNDKYGHAAGDRVLRSLARLLKQRLRGTDIVGRYGGEEFGVIMVNTKGVSAEKVIDEIRVVFSRLFHLSEDSEFSVTFSCGIADTDNFVDVKSLSEAADKALYQAKENGRNQVILNTGSS